MSALQNHHEVKRADVSHGGSCPQMQCLSFVKAMGKLPAPFSCSGLTYQREGHGEV